MARILKIYDYKDPILRTKCRDILRMEEWVYALADDMWMTMLMSKAVGLAANQVGYDYRLITIKGDQFQGPMINPVIESKSDQVVHFSERCLSMVGFEVDTGKRSQAIEVSYTDLTGKNEKITLSDFTSVIVQHEIDHLHGIVFTDYLDQELIKAR